MANDKKLCINCIHYADTFLFKHYKQVLCTNEKLDTEKENVITGGFLKTEELCLDVRLNEQLCGWEGKWFEPRSPYVPVIEAETKSIARPTTTVSRGRSSNKISLEDLM